MDDEVLAMMECRRRAVEAGSKEIVLFSDEAEAEAIEEPVISAPMFIKK